MPLICLLCTTSHDPRTECDPLMRAWLAYHREKDMAEVLASLRAHPPAPAPRRLTADEFDDEVFRQEGWDMGIGGWR